ncbi:MAG: Wzz/FepE/Etk N-terminal domain-containing protein [Dethiobacteria bacterium]
MEEQELHLRDLIEIIYRGRLLIVIITSLVVLLTLIYGFIIRKPIYEGVVRVNPTQFNYAVNDLISETGQSDFWAEALSGVEGISKPASAAGGIAIEPVTYKDKVMVEGKVVEIDKADLVEVRFRYPDAELAGKGANYVGGELLKYVRERRLEILHDKKDELTKELEMIDAQLAEIYPDAYALITRGDAESDALFGVSITEGSMNVRLVELDPAYRKLAVRRSDNLMALNAANLEIDKLENSNLMDLSKWVFPGKVPADPVSGRFSLRIAVAFIFGLLLSLFVVFFRHYMGNHHSSSRRKGNRERKIRVDHINYRVDGE